MGEVLPMPAVGDLFTDVRGDDRTMRVSYHEDSGLVVVSLWAGAVCRGSFRLAAHDVGRLVELLSGIMAPDDTGSPAATEMDTAATQQVAPSPAETGDVSRSAQRTVPAPRVA
jgi:hypothetical protein